MNRNKLIRISPKAIVCIFDDLSRSHFPLDIKLDWDFQTDFLATDGLA